MPHPIGDDQQTRDHRVTDQPQLKKYRSALMGYGIYLSADEMRYNATQKCFFASSKDGSATADKAQ